LYLWWVGQRERYCALRKCGWSDPVVVEIISGATLALSVGLFAFGATASIMSALSLETELLQIASAVGGIGGVMAVLIYITSRKDAAKAQEGYAQLVTVIVAKMDKIIADQNVLLKTTVEVMKSMGVDVEHVKLQSDNLEEMTNKLLRSLRGHRRVMENGKYREEYDE
jgi:uncharacterized membrane protein YuzA (DUF378 family)